MSYGEIMRLPYIAFVLGMLDAPQIDYDSKDKKDEKVFKPKTANEEVNSLIGALS